MFVTTHGTISENTFCKLLCHNLVLSTKDYSFALFNVNLAIVWFGKEKVVISARKKFRFRLSLPFGIFAVRKDFLASILKNLLTSGLSASHVGHCLLSDPAGDLKSLLTSGLSALRVGHCLLSDLAGDFEKLINFWVVCFSRGSLPASRPCR